MTSQAKPRPGASGNRVAFAYRTGAAHRLAQRAGHRQTLFHQIAFTGVGFLIAALVLS